MLRIARDVCRRLWLISVFLLAAAHVAAAGALSIGADFDGDGQDDRADVDRREPHAPRVRLSAVHGTIVLRGETPFAGLAPRDLADDARAELIASNESVDDAALSSEAGAATPFALPRRLPQAERTLRLATRPLSDRARSPWACLCVSFSPRPPPVSASPSLLACDG